MQPKNFEAIYTDDSLLVINKPAGLLSVPGRGADKQDCLSARVQQAYPEALIVHRLDMATSGLMVMARSLAVQRSMNQLFESRAVHKRYAAVVHGRMNPVINDQPRPVQGADSWRLIDLPIAVDWPRRPLRVIDTALGKPSQTRWRVVLFDPSSNTTRLDLEPVTGRSHQLRVHMQAFGHPILGDQLYASPELAEKSARLLLHAASLAFTHPLTGEKMHFESSPPF